MTDPRASVAHAPASIGARVLAYLLDGAVAAGGMALVSGFGAVIVFGAVRPTDPVAMAAALAVVQLIVLLVAVGWGLVYTAMQGGAGSIGQRALGLALADAADPQRPLGFGRALLRNLVWVLGGAIVVGYVSPLFDGSPLHRGWHDKAAGAVVTVRTGGGALHAPRAARPAAPRKPSRAPSARTPAAAPMLWGTPAAPATPGAPAAPLAGARPAGSAPLAGAAPVGAVPMAGAGSTVGAGPIPGAAPAAAPGTPVMMSVGMISHVPGVVHAGDAAPARTPIPTVDAAPARTPIPTVDAGPAASGPPPSGSIAETMTMTAVPQPAPAPTPVAGAPAPQADAGPGPGSDPDSDVDETRLGNAVDAPADPVKHHAAVATVAVVWDDGTRVAVYGRTLFGRNPIREDGAVSVAVRDETLSLSKTHFEVDGDDEGPFVVDRHSTNGVVLVRNGRRATLAPGTHAHVRAGDRLEIGDRSLTVEATA